jgi:peptidoglycan-N-acetylglucosamine deacetylase
VVNRARREGLAIVVLLLLGAVAVACGHGGPPSAQPRISPTPAVSPSSPGTTPVPTQPPSVTTPAPRPIPIRAASRPFPPSLAGRDVERIPTDRPVVALTFDAGANGGGVPSILATLAREHVVATFFLTGDFARQFPGDARAIDRAGHRLGNHSVSHPHFPGLTDARMWAELTGTEAAVRDATGGTTRPFFRFPYGDRNPHTIAVVNAQGYLPVRWTVDSLGWQGTSGGRTAATVTERVLSAAQPGAIVLMHVGANPTDHSTLDADALPGMIAGLRQRGYAFVTLDALLDG